MRNELNWFKYDDSTKRLESLKYNIAVSCEMGLNSFYDNEDKEPMTRREWFDYIKDYVMNDFVMGGTTYMGSHENRFAGNSNIDSHINYYIEHYNDLKPFIKEDN